MKILHLLQSSVFSGAENVVCQIMKMFANDRDIKMIYVSPKGSIKEAIEAKDLVYIGLDSLSISNIRRIVNEERPEIIHAHDISASILACLSTIGTNTQVVSHVHVNNTNMAKFNKKTVLFYLSSVRYKHIFWVSPSCYESYYFKNRVKNKSSVLCNVVDKEDILRRANDGKEADEYDIIYVGRIVYQKNPERLIKVLSEIVSNLPSVKIGIVGDGDLLEQTKILVKTMGLQNHIDFLGYKSNPLGYLMKAKTMIMTSRYEGLPMTVLEALALGVPVVSTPVDGLLNVIENGVNGYLSDDDNRLVQKTCNIVTDKNLRCKLSDNAREKFDRICNLAYYKEEITQVYKHSR